MKRYTISEYARATGTSRNAVYKKLDTSLKPFKVKEGRGIVLCFPEGVDICKGFNPASVDNSTPVNPLSTHFQPFVNADSTPVCQPVNPDSTPVVNPLSTPLEAPGSPVEAASTAAKVESLEAEKQGLTALLEAKEAHLKDLQDQLDRLAAELEQERQAGKELRQLLNQQQALTAKHLAEPKKRPLLAAIFPRLYNREDDQGQE